ELSASRYHAWVLRPIGIACALAACYNPQVQDCIVSCATPGSTDECPGDQTCGSDLRCFSTTPCATKDGGPDGADTAVCVGHWMFKPCVPSTSGLLALAGVIDTTNDPRCLMRAQPNAGPDVCVIAGGDVAVSDLTVTGAHPLALVALGDLMIGMLDAS